MVGIWTYSLRVGSQQIELPEGESTVGRSRSSGVRLEDESVSRNHAVLVCRDGRAMVRDLESSNGTFIGDRRITGEAPVLHGAVLRFGNILANFVVSSATSSSDATLPLGNPCGACGTRNPEGQPFCLNCATPLPPAPAACRACDQPIPVDQPLCPACGAPALASISSSEPPSRSPAEAKRAAGRPTTRFQSSVDLPVRSLTLEESPVAREEKTAEAPAEPLPPPEPSRGEPEPGKSGARIAAAIVDAVLLFAIDLLLIIPALVLVALRRTLGEAASGTPEFVYRGILASLLVGTFVIAVVFFVRAWTAGGATFGQRLFHLRVVGPDGSSPLGWKRATARTLALGLTVLTGGLGFVPVFFGQRALADIVAGTRVVSDPAVPRLRN